MESLGQLYNGFESYLIDRHMRVSIGDIYSKTKRLSYSVPQGSCGGPVIYSAYASKILVIIPKSINLHAFAEDQTISDSFSPFNSNQWYKLYNETKWLS